MQNAKCKFNEAHHKLSGRGNINICINTYTRSVASEMRVEYLDLPRELISLGQAQRSSPILGLQCRQMRRRITSNGLTTRLLYALSPLHLVPLCSKEANGNLDHNTLKPAIKTLALLLTDRYSYAYARFDRIIRLRIEDSKILREREKDSDAFLLIGRTNSTAIGAFRCTSATQAVRT